MMKFLKGRFVAATLSFAVVNIVGGLLMSAPLLIFLRVHLERSGSVFLLWPSISARLIGDLLINDYQALVIYVFAAIVIYIAYFPLRIFVSAGVYRMIFEGRSEEHGRLPTGREFLSKAAIVWPGFLKIGIFAVPVYLTFVLIAAIFSGFLGRIASFLGPVTMGVFLLGGSTYLQILRSYMIGREDSSLRRSVRETRTIIAASLGRILVGNISVAIAGFFGAFLLWIVLKRLRGFEWNLLTAGFSIVLQQAIIFVLCFAQVLRINFNGSMLEKGE